jgi:hypothetical protein
MFKHQVLGKARGIGGRGLWRLAGLAVALCALLAFTGSAVAAKPNVIFKANGQFVDAFEGPNCDGAWGVTTLDFHFFFFLQEYAGQPRFGDQAVFHQDGMFETHAYADETKTTLLYTATGHFSANRVDRLDLDLTPDEFVTVSSVFNFKGYKDDGSLHRGQIHEQLTINANGDVTVEKFETRGPGCTPPA